MALPSTLETGADNSAESSSYADILKEVSEAEGNNAEHGSTDAAAVVKDDEKPVGGDNAVDESGIPEAFREKDANVDPEKSGDTSGDLQKEIDEALEEISDPKLKEQKQAGIEKLVGKLKQEREQVQLERQEIDNLRAANSAVYSYAESFSDAESFEAAYVELGKKLYAYHQKPMPSGALVLPTQGTGSAVVADANDDGSPKSKHGFFFAEDDKILETAVTIAVQTAKAEVYAELGIDPKDLKEVVQTHKTARHSEAVASRAAEHLVPMQAQFGEKMTTQMISEAMLKYPDMPLVDALWARHGPTLATWRQEYRDKLAPKGKVSLAASGVSTNGSVPEKSPNSYEAIFEQMGVDPTNIHSVF